MTLKGTLREYDGMLWWGQSLDPTMVARVGDLATLHGLEVAVSSSYLELAYAGTDRDRRVVRFLRALGPLVVNATGEITCEIDHEVGDPTFEFYSIVDGRLVMTKGSIARDITRAAEAEPTSVFLETDRSMDQMLALLDRVVGRPFVRDEAAHGEVYATRVLDIELRFFGDHELEDDMGIAFTSYRYQVMLIAFRVGFMYDGFADLYASTARLLCARLAREAEGHGIVVENLQRQVYESR